MATCSEKGEMIEKVYEYKNKLYRVIENADFHIRLASDPNLMEIFFNDCHTQVSEETAVATTENETIDANKENFYWNNQNTKLLLHLYQGRKEKFRDPKVKKKSLWSEMVNEFRKHNYNVTEDILDRKMRNMKKTYRTIKDNQKLSGRGRITWEFFETFENIFFDDKTMNIGPTLSSMQCTFQPNSEQTPKQRDSVSSDNYDLISVPSRDLTKPHYDCSSLSKDSTTSFERSITPLEDSTLPSRDQRSLSRCSISPSTNSRHSSIDSYDSITLTEDCSNLDDSQPLKSLTNPSSDEEGKNKKGTVSRRKPYSMKDGAVRSRAFYEHRRKSENTEEERVKEIKELKKIFEKNNEIQENRNKLLQDLINQLKASKNPIQKEDTQRKQK